MKTQAAVVLMLVCATAQASDFVPGSRIAWDYAGRSDLRGFVCSVDGVVIGRSGPAARRMDVAPRYEGAQTISCQAVSSDPTLSSDPAGIGITYAAAPIVAAPTFFCRDADAVLSWTYSGSAKEFVLYKDGALIGRAGPGAVSMDAPPLPSGSHVLDLRARSASGALSPPVSITRTYPESGVLCDGD